MLIITVQVNAPSGQAIGIKEDIAMLLERYGDTHVTEIRETETFEQTSFLGFGSIKGKMGGITHD